MNSTMHMQYAVRRTEHKSLLKVLVNFRKEKKNNGYNTKMRKTIFARVYFAVAITEHEHEHPHLHLHPQHIAHIGMDASNNNAIVSSVVTFVISIVYCTLFGVHGHGLMAVHARQKRNKFHINLFSVLLLFFFVAASAALAVQHFVSTF